MMLPISNWYDNWRLLSFKLLQI